MNDKLKDWFGILKYMAMWGVIFLVVKWFIENLFGKYAFFFWVYLGMVVLLYLNTFYKWSI
jgi:hypothetical protein